MIVHGGSGDRSPTFEMATIQLTPPEPFNFKTPDDWPRWRRRFEQFRIASSLVEASAKKQIGTLLYCMGEESESVLMSTNATEEEQKDYDLVIGKFDSFFKVRRNVIFERARFNRRNQQPGESSEQYIMALYSLAANCNYGELEAEMIRDRLVVGIRDSSLSERLQLDPDLTLEKAKKCIRQREAVQEQQNILSGSDASTLEAVNSSSNRRKYQSSNREQHRSSRAHYTVARNNKQKQTPKQCTRCGKEQHTSSMCPARDAICHKCHKKGHYGAQCHTKKASLNDTTALDTAFLDATSASSSETAWYADIQVNKQNVKFKLDTGAEVTAISQETYQTLENTPPLNTPHKLLCGPSKKPLDVIGQCQFHLSHKGRSSQQQLYVVKGLRANLLGLPAIQALHLAARLDNTATDETPLTASKLYKRFNKVFQGLGNLGDEYEIKLKPDAKPHALFTPRRVPLPLRKKVAEELSRMEALGVISRVDVPTPWCAGMVVAPKKSGGIRLCIDLKPLNQSVLREVHPLPKVDDTLAQLSGAKLFSKLDANSGFWQIPLSPSSRLLTTFITPVGRFCFNKLPFGIASAPEHFQKRMSRTLSGLSGVVCQMDDILVFGSDRAQHDTRLLSVLQRIESAGVTLNTQKCEFGKTSIKFLGHVIDENGIRADPEKTAAIRGMKPPTTVSELRRFMGMVNQLGKFTPRLAQLSQPLRELLNKDTTWVWGHSQRKSFSVVKEELSKPTTLALYNVEAPTRVSADASSYGLGAVLMQHTESTWRPVAYASRAMTETEQRYAQIEKEALALTWACEKFTDYILGKPITVETDHKPLVPLFSTKQLHTLPPRILRFRLRMDRFIYTIHHVPGKELHTADALSRAPLPLTKHDLSQEKLAELLMVTHIAQLPASKERLEMYRRAQHSDPTCQTLMKYCRQGWPNKHSVDPAAKPFWEGRGELSIGEELLLYGRRIVIPEAMQAETLQKLHQGHQGIHRCRLRAQSSVWWPGISRRINDFITQCPECCKMARPHKEPLLPTPLPDYPWQKAGTDLFELKGATYLLVVDYFSRYPEVIQLKSTTSHRVINALKSIFARHGIPETLISDNGPQYISTEFKQFAKAYGFEHLTSSPHYPQSNGLAERKVKTVKKLLKRSADPCLSLLSYRATPLPWCGLSPSELSQGRRIRSDIPQTKEMLIPGWPFMEDFRRRDKDFKRKQKENFDRRHKVKPLPELSEGTNVWITTRGQTTPGRVVSQTATPRSYVLSTPHGEIRRNRVQLNTMPNNTPQPEAPPRDSTREPIMTRTRTRTVINPPDRLSF